LKALFITKNLDKSHGLRIFLVKFVAQQSQLSSSINLTSILIKIKFIKIILSQILVEFSTIIGILPFK
jgi:hypothetical protein